MPEKPQFYEFRGEHRNVVIPAHQRVENAPVELAPAPPATGRLADIVYMLDWCAARNLELRLQGSCGIGRECVGVTDQNGIYPTYEGMNSVCAPRKPRIWTPPDSYHKSDRLAVLGHGEEFEHQLAEWLRWLDQNGYTVEGTKVVRVGQVSK